MWKVIGTRYPACLSVKHNALNGTAFRPAAISVVSGEREWCRREQPMKYPLSLKNSFDLIAAVIAAGALLGVLQTFVIGRHFIIPTMILFWAVLFGNLARYGFQGRVWAKQLLFWIFFLFTSHAFFALFFAKKYREILGGSFEYVCGAIVVVFAWLVYQYAKKNELFR
jgi:hypothetical protein